MLYLSTISRRQCQITLSPICRFQDRSSACPQTLFLPDCPRMPVLRTRVTYPTASRWSRGACAHGRPLAQPPVLVLWHLGCWKVHSRGLLAGVPGLDFEEGDELYTSWLDTPPEEAVIQARVKADQEAERSEQADNAVNNVLDALRTNGYKLAPRIEDVRIIGDGTPGGR